MPTIDPTWRFAIQVIVFVAIGVSAGTLNLTNAIPVDLIKPVTAWCGIIAFIGTGITTTLSGLGMTTANRIASAESLASVKQIVTTPEVASATPSNKVVSQ